MKRVRHREVAHSFIVCQRKTRKTRNFWVVLFSHPFGVLGVGVAWGTTVPGYALHRSLDNHAPLALFLGMRITTNYPRPFRASSEGEIIFRKLNFIIHYMIIASDKPQPAEGSWLING